MVVVVVVVVVVELVIIIIMGKVTNFAGSETLTICYLMDSKR